ncbi:MAG: outer membrane protein assembly factor BamA [Alphaproteobacteria bacterium]
MRHFGLFAAGIAMAAQVCAVDAVQAQARRGDVIQRVAVEGTNRIDPETVGSYLQIKVGEPYDAAKVDQSLKALYATGLFADVTIRREGATVIVRVVENPIINRIAYEGNRKLKDAEITSEVPLRARSVYSKAAVEAAVKRILELYRATGRFGATVTPKIIDLPQNRVNLVFEINEGDVTAIRRIRFVGNRYFSDSSLREEIETKESAFWRFFGTSDVYDADKLAADREKLRKFYLSRGFADMRVVSAVAELTPDKTAFFITFTIHEGDRYRFGKVDVVSNLKGVQADQFKGGLRVREGRRFDGDAIESTIDSLTTIAGSMGYAFVRVNPIATPDREKKTVDITFDVREGPKVFVERIEIRGNIRTRDEVIRREMRINEGDAFNAERIRLSQRRLVNLEYFEKVDIQPREGSAPDKAVIVITVQEKATGEFSIGAGFATDEGVLGSIGIREKNFMGRGQDLGASFFLSQRTIGADISFTEPYFLERNLAFGIDVFRRERDFTKESGFGTREAGFRFRLGWRITEDLSQSVSYEVVDKRVRNISSTASPLIQAEAGKTTVMQISSTLTYDTRDNRFAPTEGYVVSGTIAYGAPPASLHYVKGILRAAYHYTVTPGWVVSVLGEAGIVEGIRQDVRLNDRFFLGGDSLRAFKFGGVGPRDAITGDALGANKYYVVTTELAFPLGLPKEFGIQGRLFADVGSAFDIDINDPRVRERNSPRIAAGVGVSWQSPFGPLRVDLGYPVVKYEGDKTQFFHFRFGARF